jgi:ribosomal protein S18 acetylase RimI-like enzyme
MKMERALYKVEMTYNGLLEKASDKRAIRQFLEATNYASYSEVKAYWYLAGLAVSPKHQRRGIGTRLINWGLKIASQEMVPVILEASMTGRVLYSKLGFQIIERRRVRDDLEGVVMQRSAALAKGGGLE